MKHLSIIALAVCVPAASFAQETPTLGVAESDEFGTYLTADDRPVYMFTTDGQGMDGTEPMVSCAAGCLAAWPLVTGDSAEAGGEVQQDLISTFQHEGDSVVAYNGWPLYYFAQDQGADGPTGQDIESFGGEWYLLRPDGTMVEDEGS